MKIFQPGWKFVGRCWERDPILVGGLNPWAGPWTPQGAAIDVIDEMFGRFSQMVPTYSIASDGKLVHFAATEVSPNAWAFWVRVPE